MKLPSFILVFILIFTSCCSMRNNEEFLFQDNRVFETSFESVSDFDGFYIVPQNTFDSNHELTTEKFYDGQYSHKAWITGYRALNNDGPIYLPHRAYPTIQLYKSSVGRFVTPCIITFYVYLDIDLIDRPAGSIDDWFSFATLSPDDSDDWNRTILVNIAPDGYMRLVHVPRQGKQEYIFQASSENNSSGSLLYPYREWVKIDIYIDLSSTNGYAKIWQNGELVSHAHIIGGNGTLAQTHFGLYASAAISSGIVYNDKLSIREVTDESEVHER